ncbi:MAG TPA: tyrosine-type recombinase/integrase, partial [Acidimicrobiales bacterium]|nr:tyrosine-type recombinase/integrase [Acidimicrobiales bacterium]
MPASPKGSQVATVTPLHGAEPAGDLPRLIKSWERSLRARNLSPRTVESYLDGGHQFVAFLAEHGYPTDAATVTREHVEEFIDGLLQRWTASTAHTRYRALGQLFKFLEDELEVIERSPMAKMRPPALVEKEIPIVTEDQMRALLAGCGGKGFEDRRDNAIFRLFVDTGMRRAEVANLRLEDVDLDNRVAYVMGKGRRPRACPFGNKT